MGKITCKLFSNLDQLQYMLDTWHHYHTHTIKGDYKGRFKYLCVDPTKNNIDRYLTVCCFSQLDRTSDQFMANYQVFLIDKKLNNNRILCSNTTHMNGVIKGRQIIFQQQDIDKIKVKHKYKDDPTNSPIMFTCLSYLPSSFVIDYIHKLYYAQNYHTIPE